ncbi:MAG: DUF92 domain-containing protein [Candidatus Diapherotrites archaeon]
MSQLTEIIILLVFLALFSLITLKKKNYDIEGILTGNIIGIASYLLGGLTAFMVIAYFFVIGEIGTRYGRNKRKDKHEKRSTGNVLGNSLPSFFFLPFSSIAFFSGIASALADTLAAEIGMLSKKKPVLITDFRKVERGTDGAITALGLIASIIGAGLIALIHYGLFRNINSFIIILIAGFLGSIADSFLGATLQRKKLLDNNSVNFFATAMGAAAAFILAKAVI